MAPEMLAHKPYGTPADVWSFNRVVHATATGDPHGTTDMDEESVRPWLWSLHIQTGNDEPLKRATAAALRCFVQRNLSEAELYMQGDAYSPPNECADTGSVRISDVLRSMGGANQQILKTGRAAQKRISSERDKTGVPAGDIHARNVSRKARRKIAKAIAKTSAETDGCSAEDVLEYMNGRL